MIEVISEGMKGNVVALRAHEMVSHGDYTKVVFPNVEEKIKAYGKVRLRLARPRRHEAGEIRIRFLKSVER